MTDKKKKTKKCVIYIKNDHCQLLHRYLNQDTFVNNPVDLKGLAGLGVSDQQNLASYYHPQERNWYQMLQNLNL